MSPLAEIEQSPWVNRLRNFFFVLLILCLSACLKTIDSGSAPSNTSVIGKPGSTSGDQVDPEEESPSSEDGARSYEVAENGTGYMGGDPEVIFRCFPTSGETARLRVDGKQNPLTKKLMLRLYTGSTYQGREAGLQVHTSALQIYAQGVSLSIDASALLADSNRFVGLLKFSESSEVLLCDVAPATLTIGQSTNWGVDISSLDLSNLSQNEIDAFNRYYQSLWLGGRIPYAISPLVRNYSEVFSAMKEVELKTPIRFVPKTGLDADYLYFTKTDVPLNSSYTGKKGGVQPVFISANSTASNILHELGHVMGLVHQVLRKDASAFVDIFAEHMLPDFFKEFDLKSLEGTSLHGQLSFGSFDYDSIMMHGPYAYSKDGLPTLLPKLISARDLLDKTSRGILSVGDTRTLGELLKFSSCEGLPFQYEVTEADTSPYELRVVALTSEVSAITPSSVTIKIGRSEKPIILYVNSREAVNLTIEVPNGTAVNTLVKSQNVTVDELPSNVRIMNDLKTPQIPILKTIWSNTPKLQIPEYKQFIQTIRAFIKNNISHGPSWEKSVQVCLGRPIFFHVPNSTYEIYARPD